MRGNAGPFSRAVAGDADPVEQLTLRKDGTSDTADERMIEWERTRDTFPWRAERPAGAERVPAACVPAGWVTAASRTPLR